MKLRRILVAVDFRPPSLRAVRWARELAGPGTRIDIAWVLPRGDGADERRAMNALEGFVTTFGAGAPGLHVRVGDPRREIGRLLDELDADLLILGRNLAGGNDGRTGEALLRDAQIPVLIAGAGSATRPRRMLVGVEDPAASRELLGSALALMHRFDAELAVAKVLPAPLRGSHHVGAVRDPRDADDLTRAGTAILDELVHAGTSPGATPARGAPTVRMEVRRGDPAAQLLALAQEGAVDLIVLGRNRHAATIGSVPRHLARMAPMSVLVVPPAAQRAARGGNDSRSRERERPVRADARGHAVGGSPRGVVRHARNVAGGEDSGHGRLLPCAGANDRSERPVLERAPELLGERARHARTRAREEGVERDDRAAG